MTIKHTQEYRDPAVSRQLVEHIARRSTRAVRLMEVCGTHTMSIFRHGIRSLLPDTIRLLSGPGCPVCVTAQGEIDAFVALAREAQVTIATFGDLMRVPGSHSSLQAEKARGADVRVVYSTLDALSLAKAHPQREVVFLGVGFETTAPTVAAAILTAQKEGVENFSVLAAHKTVPPALMALMQAEDVRVDGFLLPGHVSVIIGMDGYQAFFQRYRVPCVVAGFEPTDLLTAIAMLVDQLQTGTPRLVNGYQRAVTGPGNAAARAVMAQVFAPADARWRGIGVIPQSGLAIRPAFSRFDARKRFDIQIEPAPEPKGCACGEVLTGTKTPPQCALFSKRCTPMTPVGPCMVSSEGTCAAYYRYDAS
jgi:hydrogenase expression/formation protein HypD